MMRWIAGLTLVSVAAFGQYKAESTGAPPADVAAGVTAVLEKTGTKVLNAKGEVVYEIWLRSELPTGPKAAESAVTLPEVPHGALLGVIRFAQRGSDRRGQQIKPGFYTMRFSYYPTDGAHQGVAPQRDFLILSPAADDTDPKATPAYDPLMDMSRKASGTPHPLVFSIWKGEGTPGLAMEGEHDWVWHTKIGSTPVNVILFGQHEG
jgi:hypothetical protein